MTAIEIITEANRRVESLRREAEQFGQRRDQGNNRELGAVQELLRDALGMMAATAANPTAELGLEFDQTLALWFTPQAIKDHFGNVEAIENLPDEIMVKIGRNALDQDHVYGAFHDALVQAVEEETTVTEDDLEEVDGESDSFESLLADDS